MRTRLSARGHLKIPDRICQIIGLEPGDLVTFEIEDNSTLLIRRVEEYDEAFNLTVAESLDEWASEHDRQAFQDL
jgi:antitoxin component of MazEF toxin-antitoxin module